MINLQPWERFVARWICGPAFLVAVIGFLLLPWSLAAWYYGIPRLVPALPDWGLGITMLSVGSFIYTALHRLISHPSGLLVSDVRIPIHSDRGD